MISLYDGLPRPSMTGVLHDRRPWKAIVRKIHAADQGEKLPPSVLGSHPFKIVYGVFEDFGESMIHVMFGGPQGNVARLA